MTAKRPAEQRKASCRPPDGFLGSRMQGRPSSRRKLSPGIHSDLRNHFGRGSRLAATSDVKRSGVYLPIEPTRGATAEAFEKGSRAAMEGILTRVAEMLA